MQGKKIVKRTSFNKVQFKSFEHKQPYFCTFHFLSEGMMTIKIRDKTSTVVYLKKIQ